MSGAAADIPGKVLTPAPASTKTLSVGERASIDRVYADTLASQRELVSSHAMSLRHNRSVPLFHSA